MTSYRSLAGLGTCCLIMGACAAENPDGGGGGTGGSGGRSGSLTGGSTGTSGMPATSGMPGTAGMPGTSGMTGKGGAAQTSTGGAGSPGGQAGTGGLVSAGGHGGAGAGSAGAAGAGAGGGFPLKNAPVPSAGCGKPTSLMTSAAYSTITSSGDQRQYMIALPANYDMNEAYRIIYASHGQGGQGSDIARDKYYGIQSIAAAADSVIFVAPSGLGGIWGLKDVPLFDDILAFVKQNACVDESRVFVLGFSFGGMYSYSLSMTRQETIRAGIGMSPANYAIEIPPKMHEPIAWMQSTGMSDSTCPWVSSEAQKRGAKFIAIEHGADNECTVPDPVPTWKSGNMLCDDFAACKPGYPVKVCTFDGGHSPPPHRR